MGGFGSGGRRVGQGRKPKTTAERALTGARDRTKALDADVPAVAADVPMPQGMTEDQAAVWMELATYAMAAGTLVPATASAFRDLCEIVAMRRQMLAKMGGSVVDTDGQPHPLLVHERQYRLREEAGKARFMVAPVGRPMASKEPEADPFAEFDRDPGLSLVQGGKH